jgi:hypothetical protein
METVVQFLGMAFVCIIMICIGFTIVEYIMNGWEDKPINKKNKKLLDNMNRMSKK